MAIKNPNALRMATLISMIWVVLALYGAMFVGLGGHGILGGGIQDPDHVFPILATKLFPTWMAGIMM
jgi:Na+/proline symporter